MRSVLVGSVSMALWLGCTTPNSAALCRDGTCANPAFPYCDVEGTIYGAPGECVAVACTPGEVAACLGDDALTCNETGNGYTRALCDLGCVEKPTPHCAYLEPRYLPDICDVRSTSDAFVVTNTATFDPNLDSNCNGGIVEQAGATSICVVRHGTIAIPAGNTLVVTDTAASAPGRVLALVADDDIEIDGTLDISADGSVSGPGGGAVQSGGMRIVNKTDGSDGYGGGGAGGRTAGGHGGSQGQDAGASNAGAAAADPAVFAALLGGAAASQYDLDGIPFGGGGGGGGATLISCRGTISVDGVIEAGGGGGMGGTLFLFGSSLPGGGGGAGGYVVLQAKNIDVTGQIFANGGAGGAGMRANQAAGSAGQDGTRSATIPASSGTAQNGEGVGGNGGVGSTAPTHGTKPSTMPAAAGGGGGSVGFLQTYTPNGREPVLTPSAVSPAFQPNGVIRTR